ncbi:MAG: NADH-quinone oxidoreductase subunit NuoI [Anaerolineae bacterium CG_4_9_14_3_um_filter_57_17]|nr:NADH-quinone oxidoreductase subunit NuoI [bacterium]NCT22193.1 NADH-quinone oxidoreductase subunit NuoI [bacterium]OIO84473.1 MAG: NADH-quinone oxidoreductase subunit I [Anaerolineae bacterium CG2_30_57_67]PJB66249.1 MAG: NADH-quinone oxidoreductase subunit NuoI [Anaerolineae bacterium CG_4_9_14_3_um_filter_57_17]
MLKEFGKGLGTILRALFFEKKVTIQYPEQTRPVAPRYRGRHVLHRYDNGLEKCIGCSLCAAACPSDAIFVEASENTDEKRFSPGERYASTYEINMLRCIYCGFCEDACPTEAITLEHQYELSFTDRRDAIYTKERLIEAAPQGMSATPQVTEPGKFTRSVPEMRDPQD